MNEVNQKEALANTDDISLKDFCLGIGQWWNYLLSKWIIIVVIAILGSLIGLTYSLIKKPVYKAVLSFALEDEKASGGGGLGAAMGLASQFGIDIGSTSGGGAFSGDNLQELMRSRLMVEKTLLTPVYMANKQETLAELYISVNKFRDEWAGKPNLRNIHFLAGVDRSKFTLQQDSLLGAFYDSIVKGTLSVDKIDKKLSIITVKVISINELFSKYFTENLVKNVSDFYINTKTKKAVQNVNILQHQTDSVRNALNMALSGFASSVDANPNANPALQILRVPSQRRQVDVQANQAILTELVKNLEVSKVSLRKETPLIQIIDTPILPLEKERVSKLKGLVIGGFLAGFLATVFLIGRKILRNILA